MQKSDPRDRASRPLPLSRIRELHSAVKSGSQCDQIYTSDHWGLLHRCSSSWFVVFPFPHKYTNNLCSSIEDVKMVWWWWIQYQGPDVTAITCWVLNGPFLMRVHFVSYQCWDLFKLMLISGELTNNWNQFCRCHQKHWAEGPFRLWGVSEHQFGFSRRWEVSCIWFVHFFFIPLNYQAQNRGNKSYPDCSGSHFHFPVDVFMRYLRFIIHSISFFPIKCEVFNGHKCEIILFILFSFSFYLTRKSHWDKRKCLWQDRPEIILISLKETPLFFCLFSSSFHI